MSGKRFVSLPERTKECLEECGENIPCTCTREPFGCYCECSKHSMANETLNIGALKEFSANSVHTPLASCSPSTIFGEHVAGQEIKKYHRQGKNSKIDVFKNQNIQTRRRKRK